MEPVHVVFKGLVLWWMSVSPGLALIPNGENLTEPHYAVLYVQPTQFYDGKCPQGVGFIENGLGCVFDLNANAGPGGIQISAPLSDSPLTTNFTGIPPLQDGLYELNEHYQPGTGNDLVAWMKLANGSIEARRDETCEADCPRYAIWNLTAAENPWVTLLLANVNGNATIPLRLKPGACVHIVNSAQAGSDAHATEHVHSDGPLAADSGWCLYYKMVVGLPDAAADAIKKPGKKKGSESCPQPFAKEEAQHTLLCPVSLPTTTIACSNSQYP